MYLRNSTLSIYFKSYPITSIIIIVQILLYFLLLLPFIPQQPIYHELIGINSNISEGEVWRLITPLFVHLSFSHFFYNTLSIAIMGPFIENLIGNKKYLMIYLLSGIAGNLATFLFLPLTYAHVGSSGAILGLLGCFLLFLLQKRFFTSNQNQYIVLTLIVISVIMTLFQSDVNIIAHIAGFLTGVLLGWYFSSGNLNNKELFR